MGLREEGYYKHPKLTSGLAIRKVKRLFLKEPSLGDIV